MSDEVFEISDFTNASDWERFVADFEEIIAQWRLSSGQSCPRLPLPSQRTIRFARTAFKVILHSEDVPEGDFAPKGHCLQRWFGCETFLVIVATDESIATEDRVRLLLSGVAMAAANTSCPLPVFVQLSQRTRRLFAGIRVNQWSRTHFQVLHFNAVPQQCRHLSGLLDLFRDKLRSHEVPPVFVSVRLTHALNRWPPEWAPTPPSDLRVSVTRMTWSVSADPLHELQMASTWPSVSEEVIMDSAVHSALDPDLAPTWSLRALFVDDVTCALSATLDQLLSITTTSRGVQSLLSESEVNDSDIEFRHALQRLTNAGAVGRTGRTLEIKDIVDRVFEIKEEEEEDHKQWSQLEEEFANKSSPFGSLSWRISIALANALFLTRDVSFVASVWREVLRRLRHLWDESECLPNVSFGGPDLRSCLLHQKLQMINSCVEEKRKRMSEEKEREERDEEFFDCEEEAKADFSEPIREGVLRVHEWLTLVNEPTVAVCVPKTQEAPPLTEDMLAEQLAILTQLGTGVESAGIRARMQSQSLVSDMMAFKAANGGQRCAFADFVRWHSPRDWTSSEDNCSAGALSPRFAAAGNVWLELWEGSEALPVCRQKRLFDEQTETEKVLHFLSALSLPELVDLILPTVAKACALELRMQCVDSGLTADSKSLTISSEDMVRVCAQIRVQESRVHRFQSLVRKLWSTAAQMEPKSDDDEEETARRVAERLLSEPEVEFASDDVTAGLVRRLFSESVRFAYGQDVSVGERDGRKVRSMPAPIAREFVLRADTSRPNARPVPQRMYALLSEKEFRISGAFTEDTTF